MMGKFLEGRFWKILIVVAVFCTCNAWSGEAAERQAVDQKLEDYVGQLEVSIITKQHKDFILKEVEEVGSVVLGFHSKPAAEIVAEVFNEEKPDLVFELLEKLELSKHEKLGYLNSPEVEVHKFALIVAKDEKSLSDLLS